ncbi:unnamed protein product [Adineta steineri]|uniref:Uncharacterized protein n=1 Tax=Adineta steineri TaxID=433720 RepID=A0A814QBQ1_9BILA|nr:unnamed protein product [Adineta steineri]
MNNSRKTLDTLRRSSQRRNSRRIDRIQRQTIIDTLVSNLCQIVDPYDKNDTTQVSIPSLSSTDHDDNVQDIFITTSKSFEMHNLQLDPILMNNNSELTENEKKEFVGSDLHSNLNEDPNEHVSDCDLDENVLNQDRYDDSLDENVFDDDVDKDSHEEETFEMNAEELFGEDGHFEDRTFTSVEIALALSLLKFRHSLTNICITNICKLLKMLRVQNSPTNFRHIRSLICNSHNTTIFSETLISCPSCRKISDDTTRCTSILNCINKDRFMSNPTVNHILKLEPQIRSILERNTLMLSNKDENSIEDIIDASYYRKLRSAECDPFITILMNSDGAVVKSISKSVWISSFVINELSPSVRYNRENIIVAMLSVGSVKPNKDEMQVFLKHLTEELLHLEHYGLQYTSFSSSMQMDTIVRVFLIAASCDKPAASLLINHTETGGFYGCIYCILIISQRSVSTQRRASTTSINTGLQGLRGECALRTLKYFDVYQSFVSDTLHTLYEGAMARMLHIFFGTVSEKSAITREMNIKGALDAVSSIVKSISYPSTTYRIPRNLRQHNVYKANEYKMVLLFGYNAFDHVLDQERYNHFKCLAFASHLIEAAKIDQSTYRDVHDLLEEFNTKFESLYTKKQAKPVIHALNHFAECMNNYGPAFRYSTFEFESTVATLTRLVHNGNTPTIELLRNLDLLRQTWLSLFDLSSSSSSELRIFDQQITSNVRQSIPVNLLSSEQNPIRLHKIILLSSLPHDINHFVIKYCGQRPYQLFKTVFFKQKRLSSDHSGIFGKTHDGCLMYKRNNVLAIGFLQIIISFYNCDQPVLVIRPVTLISTSDSLSINGRTFKCTNVLYGTCDGTVLEASDLGCIIQKLAFRPGTDIKFPPARNSMFFFQYPNLTGST